MIYNWKYGIRVTKDDIYLNDGPVPSSLDFYMVDSPDTTIGYRPWGNRFVYFYNQQNIAISPVIISQSYRLVTKQYSIPNTTNFAIVDGKAVVQNSSHDLQRILLNMTLDTNNYNSDISNNYNDISGTSIYGYDNNVYLVDSNKIYYLQHGYLTGDLSGNIDNTYTLGLQLPVTDIRFRWIDQKTEGHYVSQS